MAAHPLPAAALGLVILFALATTTQSNPCLNCSKDFKTLSCSLSTPEEERYTLKITDHKDVKDGALSYQCHYTTQQVHFTFHKGCNFSSVQSVTFKRCPLFNVSFSEIFTQLGIFPENVLQLIFENSGTRKDLKLETWHLSGLTNLEILQLNNNQFTSLPPDILKATPNLEHFLFSRNSMPSLPETIFANTPKLVTINLLNNNFESLPENLLVNVSSLAVLRIYGNALREFNPKLFANIPEVYNLELSINKLTKLTSDTFQYLPKLQQLYLKLNDLESLPEDIFHNCPDLQIVHLRNNRLLFIPSELFNMSKNISDFDFHNNEVTKIPQLLFQGLENLTTLTMSENSLEDIPDGTFTDLVKLEKLLLQNNPLKTIPPGSFDQQRRIKRLSLANTSLTDLPDNIFKNCESLEEIDLSDNHLSKLKSTFFPHSTTVLRSLKLSKNNLSFSALTSDPRAGEAGEVLVEQFPLSDQVSLIDLILNNNNIKVIPHALRNLKKLRRLDLKNNSIEYLDYYEFLFGQDRIDFDPNDASQSILQNSELKQYVNVELRDNPLVCDCNLYKFSQLVQDKISEEEKDKIQLKVVDKARVKCSFPNDRSVQKLVRTLDISILVCYRNHCHPSCDCATRPHDHMFIMECAHQRLRAIPPLKQYLPKGNYSVTLDLKNNSITSLEGLQRPEYSTLVNLTMPYNYLRVINESYLTKRLQALDVDSNALTHFSPSLVDFLNATNANLSLGGNPWVCDCKLVNLYIFLRDPLRKLASSHSVMCDNLKKPLLSLAEEELCPTIQQPMVVITIVSTTLFLFLFFVLG
ncbi:Protein toll [Chionoecetes opilio]|uniref:Protein toll n=1 Tax=Chionoecetes opilio TaxID=41210 RepID=A0A8J4XYK4_CHIOP|nr:Protein toll [Chionoecetes opilio]